MSSRKSGYAMFTDGELTEYGVWELSDNNEKDWRKRIAYMATQVGNMCETHNIKKIFVEDVPPTLESTQTVKVLSALQGMLIAIAQTYNIEVSFVSVKTWKSKIGINLSASKENNQCKKRIKDNCGKSATKNLNLLKGWVKGWEKKMSVEYVNYTFGLDLVYKSPSSKFNQDDIADAINIAWSQIGDGEPYNLDTFEAIMDNFYELITSA